MDIIPDDLKYEILDTLLISNDLSTIINLCSVDKSYRNICEKYNIWKKIGKKIYLTEILNPKFSSWREWVLSNDRLFITDKKLKEILTIYYNELLYLVEDSYHKVEMIDDEQLRDELYTLMDFYSNINEEKINEYVDKNMKWFNKYFLDKNKFNYINGRYYFLDDNKFIHINKLLIDNNIYNGYWFHKNIIDVQDEENYQVKKLLEDNDVFYIYNDLVSNVDVLTNNMLASIKNAYVK